MISAWNKIRNGLNLNILGSQKRFGLHQLQTITKGQVNPNRLLGSGLAWDYEAKRVTIIPSHTNATMQAALKRVGRMLEKSPNNIASHLLRRGDSSNHQGRSKRRYDHRIRRMFLATDRNADPDQLEHHSPGKSPTCILTTIMVDLVEVVLIATQRSGLPNTN